MTDNNSSESRRVADIRASPRLAVAMAQAGNDEANDRHFRTDHLLANLRNRTISSGFITMTSQGIQFILTLGSTMILARLLTPGDFGLLAMVWTIMGFLRVFKEAGLSTATVQREGITHAQVSNLFWVNAAVSGFVAILVAAAAPVIAWFFRDSRLVGITLALSTNFLLAGLAVQHMALLNRQMRFTIIALIQIGSVLIGVLVGVGMAWLNYGYWSLVGLNLATSIAALLMTWSASRWRPNFFRWRSGTRSLLHFGANLTAGAFFYSLARGLDALLIGRVYGAASVGIYSRAAAMLSRPLEQFMAPIEAVFIPAFSRLQTQPERYRRIFLQLYEAISLTGFFFAGMFFALAHPLTLVVLGPKWGNAVAIFGALTFAAITYPVGACTSWLFISQGRGRDSFRASLIVSIILAGSFVVGLPFGPFGVAVAYSSSYLLLQLPIYYWLAGRRGPISTSDLWVGFLKHFPLWIIVCGAAWLMCATVSNFSALVQLAICVPVSLLAGVVFISIYAPSRRVAANLFSTLRELKSPAPSEVSSKADGVASEASPSVMLPGITVVIPTFNRERLVKRAIESVLNQSVKAGQIIVVDDGSTDNTPEVCSKFSGSIEYVRQHNAGVSQARNHGIKLARHAWIAFLDSDDYWTSNHLESIKAAIKETDGRARFYFTNTLMTGEAQETTLWSQIGFKLDAPYLLVPDCTDWMLGCRQPASIQSSVFNAALLKASDGFDKRVEPREDAELFCRLGIGGSACAVNAVGCIYTADDNTDIRLTTKVHIYTEQYWKRASMLWSILSSHFPDLNPKHRRIIHTFLADAYWRLARIYWKSGRFFQGGIALLQCLAAQPSFLIMHLGGCKSAKWSDADGRPVLQSECSSAADINAQTTRVDH